jgi:cystathionine beta-lyase/cystathionine gamma-synthase
MAAATLVTTLGRPQEAEGVASLNAPIVLGSTCRADGAIAYGRDANPSMSAVAAVLEPLLHSATQFSGGIEDVDDLWHDLERALDR